MRRITCHRFDGYSRAETIELTHALSLSRKLDAVPPIKALARVHDRCTRVDLSVRTTSDTGFEMRATSSTGDIICTLASEGLALPADACAYANVRDGVQPEQLDTLVPTREARHRREAPPLRFVVPEGEQRSELILCR